MYTHIYATTTSWLQLVGEDLRTLSQVISY